MTTKIELSKVAPEFLLQEVSDGCFVWQKMPNGWVKIDFFDSIYLAQSVFPEAMRGPLPQELITDSAGP